ncbi:MAG: hypothetical protein KDI39_09450 [Pseudomonadales bacterium]|nr:hypothetical protein [Pseudomonadales bacterium]
MSFLNKAKEALESAAKAAKEAAENTPSKAQEGIDFIKQNIPKTIPLSVSEAQLNEMVKKAIADDSRIKSLTLTCEENELAVEASIQMVGGLAITAKTRLALEHCELSPTRKTITMRRLDQTELGGMGVASSLLAHVIKLVVCGLFAVDIGAFSLKNINGITIDKSLITADLAAMGATEAVNNAITNKINVLLNNTPINPLLKIVVSPLLPALAEKLIDKITIEDLKVAKTGITGTLRLSQ